jgi:hypothetical protein
MAEETKSYKAYLVTDEQLQALKATRNPQITEVVTAIEGQHVGSLRGAAAAKVGEAKGVVVEKYKAAINEAIAKVEAARGGTE